MSFFDMQLDGTAQGISRVDRDLVAKLMSACISIVVLALPANDARAEEDQAVLDRIRAGYVQTITSMRTIWCRFDTQYEPGKEPPLDCPLQRSWEWAVEGPKYHLSALASVSPNGDQYDRVWFASAGDEYWRIKYNRSDVVKRDLTDGVAQIQVWITPGRILGYYFNIGEYQVPGLTLQSILETQPVRLGGLEPVEGHDCWRLEFAYPGVSPDRDCPMTVWLDPEAGYLPRRLRDFPESSMTVLEYTRVAEKGDGQVLPFPRRIRSEWDSQSEMITVHDVSLNDRLAADLFRPRIPQGYKTYDLDNKEDVRTLLEQRQPKAETTLAERRVEQEQRNLMAAGTAPAVDASPRRRSYAIIILITGGLVILLTCTVFVFLGRR